MATSLKIENTLEERILQIASQRHRSPEGIMLEALEQYAEREEARNGFREEAEASWADYQANGRHLTGDEVRAWLKSWGNDDGRPVPECHD